MANAPRKSFATTEIIRDDNGAAIGVQWTFTNDETRQIVSGDFPDDIRAEAAAHGFKQKLCDGYGSASDVQDANDAVEKFDDMVDRMIGGDWNARRGPGSDLAEAIHRVTGEPIAKCRHRVHAMKKSEREQWEAHPKLAEALAEIAQERAERKRQRVSGDAPDLSELF